MLIVFIGAVAGFIFGIATERKAWTMRGDRHSNHYCNGKMYYVTTEEQHVADMDRWLRHGRLTSDISD